MTHYEERLEEDLALLNAAIGNVARHVEQALKDAVHALLTGDHQLAYAVVMGDQKVNRSVYEIDRRCHAFIARHLPSASHLRRVSSMLRLDIELERVGDYAVSIARVAVSLSAPPPESVASDIDRMADQTREVLRKSIASFLESDAELARIAKESAYAIEKAYERLPDAVLAEAEAGRRPLPDLFALVTVFQRLRRVLDQSENICEGTLFAELGEMKRPMVYKVLFVDRKNTCASQIAEAIARKAFPNSGEYSSAGWEPGEEVDPALVEFMERKGLSLELALASNLPLGSHELNDYHVVVSLWDDVRERVPQTAWGTVFLQWDVGRCPMSLSGDEAEAQLDDLHRRLAGEIEDLMVTLRGEDAD